MKAILIITRYPKYFGFFGLLSMALFRFPLRRNKSISFWKLMGCGKNGALDIHPDWRQWAILLVLPEMMVDSWQVTVTKRNDSVIRHISSFISNYLNFFNCETFTIILNPIEGHGEWDGKTVFGELAHQSNYNGIIAVLTRASIRASKIKNFWKHVNGVAQQMRVSPGFIFSAGIGELPWIKQATFSVWQSKEEMMQFAYHTHPHKEVIQKTRAEKWYSEEMFVRFIPVAVYGTINGTNPLEGKL